MFVARQTRVSAQPVLRKVQKHSVRMAHGVSYGPEVSFVPYVKWIAGTSAIVGLITYDRFFSNGTISKWVTPSKPTADEIAKQRERFVDQQLTEQDRAITLLWPTKRSVSVENFSPHPVPEGASRAAHTSDVLDVEKLEARRGRTQVFK